MKEFGLTQAESDRLMRQVALEAIAERPAYYVDGSLKMAWQIVLGKEKEDTYSDRWVMRSDKDWVEQWESRVDHLLTPSTAAEQASVETAQWLTEIFQPAALGPVLPLLAGPRAGAGRRRSRGRRCSRAWRGLSSCWPRRRSTVRSRATATRSIR